MVPNRLIVATDNPILATDQCHFWNWRNRCNRPCSFATTDHATFATVATDPRNRRNRMSDKFQIFDWPCFLGSQIIRVFYYLKESRCVWREHAWIDKKNGGLWPVPHRTPVWRRRWLLRRQERISGGGQHQEHDGRNQLLRAQRLGMGRETPPIRRVQAARQSSGHGNIWRFQACVFLLRVDLLTLWQWSRGHFNGEACLVNGSEHSSLLPKTKNKRRRRDTQTIILGNF